MVHVDSTKPVITCSRRTSLKRKDSVSAKKRYLKRSMARESSKSRDTRRKSADWRSALTSLSEILCFLIKRRVFRNSRLENRSHRSSGVFKFSLDSTNAERWSVYIGESG